MIGMKLQIKTRMANKMTQVQKQLQAYLSNRTLAYNVSDPEYPEEWTYAEGTHPTCTAFVEDTPENEQKKKWMEQRDKNTPDLFEQTEPPREQ